jgi:carboxyl-terminal processing protease
MKQIIDMAWQRVRPFQTSILVVFVFAAGLFVGSQHTLLLAQGNTMPPRDAEADFAPFWQVYNLIEDQYLDRDTLSRQELVDGAIEGMMATLGDEFSGYMSAEVFPMLNDDLSGQVQGIGAVVELVEGGTEVQVVNVLEGSPAEAAGILPGDIFVEVDGVNVTETGQFNLVAEVRGPEGSTVNLVMRRSDELLEFSIVRARITVPIVEHEILDNNIGYVQLREFSSNAVEELQNTFTEMNAESLEGLILDLRGNPGGLLNVAIDVSSLFIKDGTIVSEQFADGREQVFEASGTYLGYEVPLVILVDENSASASEIVAGALQDLEQATIIGMTTFGKGTVQTWQELVNGGGVRLTIARWLTPDGNWIHGNGITPDIVVEWPREDQEADETNDPQLNAAIEHLLDTVPAAVSSL